MTKIITVGAVGLFAVALIGSIAAAQQVQEVTVQASRIIEKQAGHTSSGVPIVDVSLAYGVSYAGLDLVSHDGVMELERRVNAAARQACKELRRYHPHVGAPSDAECAKTAADKAMIKVNELAASAGKIAAH
jgi:UrcA family protein